MKRAALGALVCLCGVLTFAVEASVFGKEAGSAAGAPTLEPVQPVLDLAESTSASKDGVESNSASKDKHNTTATSTAATLSTVATGGSGSTRAGDAMPR